MKNTSPGLQVGQQARQVGRLVQHRPGGLADLHAHLVGENGGQRGLAQSGRPVEQHVVDVVLAAGLRRLDVELQLRLGLFLAGKLIETARTQRAVELGILVEPVRVGKWEVPFVHLLPSLALEHRSDDFLRVGRLRAFGHHADDLPARFRMIQAEGH